MFDLVQRLSGFPQAQREIIKRFLDQFEFDLRCAAPGVIVEFDSVTQTAKVQLCIKELIRIQEKDFVYQKTEQIPELLDVPVVMPRAGNYVITLPVSEGDECLVVFGDTCIDSWWQNSCNKNSQGKWQAQEPMSMRRHDLSDAFAILGVWSQPNKIDSYLTDGLEIRNLTGNTKVTLKDDEISISQGSTVVKISNGEVTIVSDSVKLGANSGLRKLIDSRLISLYNAHIHSGVQTGGGVSGTPSVTLTEETVATEVTEAI